MATDSDSSEERGAPAPQVRASRRRSAYPVVQDKRAWEGPDDMPSDGFPGWHTRGYLPHCDKPGLVQFVSFRLCDAMPLSHRHEWEPLIALTDERERILKIEAYLDRGSGACCLRDPKAARYVQDAFLFFDGERYRLIAWVVMPNHVHVLLEVWTVPLEKLIQSWKSYTASNINRMLGRSGPLWQEDYFDRYIRDEAHFCRALHYTEWNPVKARLVSKPEDWHFSSAHADHLWTSRDPHLLYSGAHLVHQKWTKVGARSSSSASNQSPGLA